MADFTDIIQEINTNLPDNNTQSITAEKLRTTLIDLTEKIDDVQDDFETNINDEFSTLEDNITHALDNLVVDNLTSTSTYEALAANQGRVLNEKINDLPYTLSNVETWNVDLDDSGLTIIPWYIGVSTKNWIANTTTGNTSCYIINVSEGSKIEVLANSSHTANIGFLDDFPTPVSGESANLVENTSIYSVRAGNSDNFVAPRGTKYLYIKKGEGNSANYNKPNSVSITPIELATSDDIKPYENLINTPLNPTLYNAIVVQGYIGRTSQQWIVGNSRSSFIPVEPGYKVHIIAPIGNSINFGFVSEYPNPVDGESAGVIEEVYGLGTTANPIREGYYTAPEGSKYLYLKLREGQSQFTPQTLEITPNNNSLVRSYYSEDYYDTYIEEDIFSKYIESTSGNYTNIKWYKIDEEVRDKYKLIIKTTNTNVYLRFADINKEIITSADVASTSTEFKVMVDIDIPSNASYILVQPYLQPSTGSTKVTKGCGALMKPLKYCNSTPKNDYIYCVSRISDIANTPNNYYSGEIYPTISDWSAWMFRLPKNTNSVDGKPNPIAAFFHGQSGWVSSEQMGYNNESSNTRMIEDLVDAGFIVFDINGYGVSWQSDEKSMFWGCRMGVDTAKKAYETIVERFNGRREFFISGISMGGAIGKSYPMIYPNDVVACALEAPTEIGLTIRSYAGDGSQTLSHRSIYKAFGYASDVDMANDLNRENCIGLSPCVKPLEIDSETGMLKYIGNVMTYDRTYMKEHTDDFYAKFPVEVRVWHSPLDNTSNGGVDYEASLLFVNSLRKANCNAILRKVELPEDQTQHSLNFYPWIRQEIVEYAREKMMK